jgi:hypothetical protein
MGVLFWSVADDSLSPLRAHWDIDASGAMVESM